MKICVAQTRSIKGDIQKNIENHKALINVAVANAADMIIFPELSLTGYEPELANEVATVKDDNRFNDFQKISDAYHITIGVGAPTKNTNEIQISMILFRPHQSREIYGKKYLHADEEPFFVSGQSSISFIGEGNIALAICYEISIPEHSENAIKTGAKVYIASVAKSASGIEKSYKTLSDIALKYSITVLMSNCVGYCDNFLSTGNTSIWNDKGVLLDALDKRNEGILIVDTDTQKIIKKTIER